MLFSISLACLIGALIISVIAPSEKVLGKILGLIYLHIGFVLGALLLFLLSAVGAIFYLVTKKDLFRAFERNALLLGMLSWIIYIAFSMLIAYLSWGAVNWQEPRLVIAFQVVFFVALILLLRLVANEIYSSILTIIGGIGSIAIWSRRWDMLHPEAPIRFSNSIEIKAMALAVILLVTISLISLLIARTVEDVGT